MVLSARQEQKRWRWVVLVACFISVMMSAPVVYSFGIFVLPWKAAFSASGAAISLVTSCGSAVSGLAVTGLLGSLLVQKRGYRVTHVVGGLLMATGYGAASFATSLTHIFIAYSIVAGTGVAFCIASFLNAVSEHFHDRQGPAFAIVSSAYGFGGIVFPVILQSLIENYGWRGAMLICAGLQANVIVCGLLTYPVHETPPWPRFPCLERKAGMPRSLEDEEQFAHAGDSGATSSSLHSGLCDEAPDSREGSSLGSGENCQNNNVLDTKYDEKCAQEDVFVSKEADHDPTECTDLKPPFNVVTKTLIRRGSFYIASLHNLAGNMGFLILMGLTPIRAAYDLDLTDDEVTFLMSTFGVAQLIFRLFFGALAEMRVAKPTTLYFVFHLVGGISTLLSVFARTFVTQVIYCTIASSGVGCLSFYPVVMYQIFERRLFNVAVGFLSIMLGVGAVAGPFLGGYIFDVTGTSQYSFLFAGVCILFSILTLLFGSFVTKEIKRLRHYVRLFSQVCNRSSEKDICI